MEKDAGYGSGCGMRVARNGCADALRRGNGWEKEGTGSGMVREMVRVTYARLVWRKYKRRFGLDGRTVTLVLAGESRKVDYYALAHLEDYVKRKVASRAVVLASDAKALRQARKRRFPFPVDVRRVAWKEILLLHEYYCFEEYFDNIAFTFIRRPEANMLWKLLRETDVDEEEVACLGCYCLRRMPEA